MPGGLLTALGALRLRIYLKSLARHVGAQAALLAVLLLMLLLAGGFGVTAVTIWLADQLGAAAAFAIEAAGALMAALAIYLVVALRRQKWARRPALFSDAERSEQAALGSIAVLAVIGYFLGRRAERS